MPDNEKLIVVAARVLDLVHTVRGSQALPCSRCGQATWFSPASVPLIVQGSPLLCLPCFLETYSEGEVRVLADTLSELQRELGRTVSMADIILWIEEIKRRAKDVQGGL